ncbi:hypothetical protein [Gulosibacter molinativorax]|uniref:hypothetical protein n=1 Tax=Gulosibacter molinativorax TaxID=256821 RepID=UPI0004087322|nr:hypothetical protein [Gulosibacter molinativorax]QUY61202.1 Sulfate permease [Gulosibacter molinativorax]
MIRQLWTLSIHTRAFLRRYMPTNILLDAIRTRRGLKWGLPTMLLAVPYLLAASICTNLIDNGAPGWLYLVVLLCVWNALKLLWIGPVNVIHCLCDRARKIAVHRKNRTDS